MKITKPLFPFITTDKCSAYVEAILYVATVLIHYYPSEKIDAMVEDMFNTYINRFTAEEAVLLLEEPSVLKAVTKEQIVVLERRFCEPYGYGYTCSDAFPYLTKELIVHVFRDKLNLIEQM